MDVRVKICGITTQADAWSAVEAGAAALGFMFYQKSPRWISPSAAGTIIRELPSFVAKVGVFVNASAGEVRAAIAESQIDTLQFHGEEPASFCRQFSAPIIKAFRMQDAASLAQLNSYESETWLLDSYVAGVLGGTGSRFNWDLALEAVRRSRRVILAGGLTPQNVAEAVQWVRPFGLDVSSGVESAPGKKDGAKIRQFIAAARAAALDDPKASG